MQKDLFIIEAPPAEVVNGRKRPRGLESFLSVQCEKFVEHGEQRIDCAIAKRKTEQQATWQLSESFASGESNPGSLESSPALPAQPETPIDGHLAGLLTYASMSLKRLPGSSRPFTPTSGANGNHSSGMLLRFSAHTVAGQWRILTALPITRWKEVIDESGNKVKGVGEFGKWVIW